MAVTWFLCLTLSQRVLVIPKMGGDIPLTQIIMGKLIKASLLIALHWLSLPKCGVQEISTGCEKDKVSMAQG